MKKIDPLLMKLMNEECLPFVFSYLDGNTVKTIGSKQSKSKMDKEVRCNPAWLKAFKNDGKELLREREGDYFDVEAEGGDIFFVSNATNVSFYQII